MSTINFVPPALVVEHMEDSRRQLEFKQNNEDDVSVRVHFGLNEINKVFQENIFIERNVVGLRQIKDVTLENLTPVVRKNILKAIEQGTAKIRTEDGKETEIKKRNSTGFYREVKHITVIL